LTQHLARAGHWLLSSGIQEPDGGMARYYRADHQRNQRVSTEITGYGASAFSYLHVVSGDQRYLERAIAAGRYLTATWERHGQAMPFELDPPALTYFFDCGIVVRGLLAAWRSSGERQFLEVAVALGESMARDFASEDGRFHAILSLADKRPVAADIERWSHGPGCYQLKSAMCWWDLAEATGEARFRKLYNAALESALRSYGAFLPGHPDRRKVMDRLHAFLYFLEGLLPRADDRRCASALCYGIGRVSELLRDIASEFERSDVYAQLLRIRILAAQAGVAPLDTPAAQFEAQRLAAFQAVSPDPRVGGSYYFGRAGTEWLPHVSPVSTAFALQALALWDGERAGAGLLI